MAGFYCCWVDHVGGSGSYCSGSSDEHQKSSICNSNPDTWIFHFPNTFWAYTSKRFRAFGGHHRPNFAAAILIESGLSFLGIGVQPPIPSWGTMIKDHYQFLVMGKPYLALIPGLAIMLLVSSFMLIGNSLRDYFDPVKR